MHVHMLRAVFSNFAHSEHAHTHLANFSLRQELEINGT